MAAEGVTRVAIVGGGVAGCAAARVLAECAHVHVDLFDWGRAVGGRSSHRCRPEPTVDGRTISERFDHGAQLCHVTDGSLLEYLRPALVAWPPDRSRLGWLTRGAFSPASVPPSGGGGGGGFFGACSAALDGSRFVGAGGMDALARELVEGAKRVAPGRVRVHEGTRVAQCERAGGAWALGGDGLGHDRATASALAESAAAGRAALGEFDELIVSDHMALAMPAWHPSCLDGLEDVAPELVRALRARLRWDEGARRFGAIRPLFTCMVAYERPAGGGSARLPFDAASVHGSEVLQWVCAQDARPHARRHAADGPAAAAGAGTSTAADHADARKGTQASTPEFERWVLVSTEAFARACLGQEGMSRARAPAAEPARAGAPAVEYVPQADGYLRADPAEAMVAEFEALAAGLRGGGAQGGGAPWPRVVCAKAQRWGAALCAPDADGSAEPALSGVLDATETGLQLSVCGDFLARLLSAEPQPAAAQDGGGGGGAAPGRVDEPLALQRAALSGMDAARRLLARRGL